MIVIIKNIMTSEEEIQKTPNELMKETWPRFTRRSSVRKQSTWNIGWFLELLGH